MQTLGCRPGINPSPLPWKCGGLATGSSEKFLEHYFFFNIILINKDCSANAIVLEFREGLYREGI